MKAQTLLKVLVASAVLGLASSSYAGVAKVLRVDNNLDSDVTVFINGTQVGTTKKGTISTFTLPATQNAAADMQLTATEADGGVYLLDVKDAHPNGFTWGLFEGDGQG